MRTILVGAALVVTACTAATDAAPPGTTPGPGATGPPRTSAPVTVPPPATSAPTTLPAWTATTSIVPPPLLAAGPCAGGGGPLPGGGPGSTTDPFAAAEAGERLAPALERIQGAGGQVGVTVWVDGVGEVASSGSTTLLVPASNQKLFVAFAALDLLPADTTLETTVVATGPIVDGVVRGDLVLVGGGDPTLTLTGPHSLDALAVQVQSLGVSTVTGRLLVDESRYDDIRTGDGWADGFWQGSNVGLLSALVVDRNRNSADPEFAVDPTLSNLRSFRRSLAGVGIEVAGADERGSGQAGEQLAALTSPPLPELITSLLSTSDNLAAELLLKELGWRTTGEGSAVAGIAAARAAIGAHCVALDGTDSDGSGLSRTDARSPDAWRRLLEAARTRPWFPIFRDALAVSGRSGTLASRLTDGDLAGRVQAKTGSTAVAGALSGYLTTSGGASVTFSIVVNQPRGAPEPFIDDFVATLVREL